MFGPERAYPSRSRAFRGSYGRTLLKPTHASHQQQGTETSQRCARLTHKMRGSYALNAQCDTDPQDWLKTGSTLPARSTQLSFSPGAGEIRFSLATFRLKQKARLFAGPLLMGETNVELREPSGARTNGCGTGPEAAAKATRFHLHCRGHYRAVHDHSGRSVAALGARWSSWPSRPPSPASMSWRPDAVPGRGSRPSGRRGPSPLPSPLPCLSRAAWRCRGQCDGGPGGRLVGGNCLASHRHSERHCQSHADAVVRSNRAGDGRPAGS